MFKSFLSAFILVAFIMVPAAFASQAQKTDNTDTEFQQKANAKFEEYDKKFKEWGEKAKGQSEKFYQEQKRELEKHRAESAKDIKRLNARGKEYGKESWNKLKGETNKALDEFGKALERAGAKLRRKESE